MSKTDKIKFPNHVLNLPVLVLFGLWTVFWIEIRFGVNFNFLGIYPRKLFGLIGILCSPFIHASAAHLYSNSIPLAVLLGLSTYFYPHKIYRILLIGGLVTGFITWVIGRSTLHIGASGLIYFLASYIFFNGLFSGYYRHMALSLLVVFLYGGMIWYILPIQEGISWESHLSGTGSGLLLALLLRGHTKELAKYEWEQEDFDPNKDPFLKHFDASGNFVPQSEAREINDVNSDKGPKSK
ncbi:MAG: hypothetical protein RLZZ241_526 [Bacteroidota bacterium]|jgi:membrane associated rhomboid family serine protease